MGKKNNKKSKNDLQNVEVSSEHSPSNSLTAIYDSLQDMQALLSPLLSLSEPNLDLLLTSLSESQLARLRLALASSLNCTLYALLKMKNTPLQDHVLLHEMKRMNFYCQKLDSVQQKKENKEKNVSLNMHGSIRTIRSALWESNPKS